MRSGLGKGLSVLCAILTDARHAMRATRHPPIPRKPADLI